MNEDFAWFRDHYEEFQSKYGNAFIAIKNMQILGVYNSYGEAVRTTSKTEKIGTFIVQECSKNGKAYYCSISSMNFS